MTNTAALGITKAAVSPNTVKQLEIRTKSGLT